MRLAEYHYRRDEMVGAVRELTKRYLGPVDDASILLLSPPTSGGNIVGIGIGERYYRNEPTGELAIKVHVVEKVPIEKLDRNLVLPKEMRGYMVDVEAVGRIELRANTARMRPALGGSSIGHFRITAGTFGCLVERAGERFILSNNHVLADQNRGTIGDIVLQPGPFDGGVVGPDDVAGLVDWSPVNTDGMTPNKVDAAIARPNDARDVRPEILETEGPRGVIEPEINRTVVKSGRTTQLTRGMIKDVEFTIRIPFENGVALFSEQMVIKGLGATGFSAPGDSGSIVLDERTQYACGLLFAGSRVADVTYANYIQNVLDHFRCELVWQ